MWRLSCKTPGLLVICELWPQTQGICNFCHVWFHLVSSQHATQLVLQPTTAFGRSVRHGRQTWTRKLCDHTHKLVSIQYWLTVFQLQQPTQTVEFGIKSSMNITLWALTMDSVQRKQSIIKDKEPPAFLNSCATTLKKKKSCATSIVFLKSLLRTNTFLQKLGL